MLGFRAEYAIILCVIYREVKMRVKYNRISTIGQSFDRQSSTDRDTYDLELFDKISGSVPFKDRPEAKKLFELVESGIAKEIIVEDFTRLGRSTSDIINTLEYFESKQVNVCVRNLGLNSRQDQKPNPIWSIMSAILSAMATFERANILERTTIGRQMYLFNGGKLGRKKGSHENARTFLLKPKSQKIAELLEKKRSYSEICKIVDCSPKTISKVKTLLAES